MPDDTTQRVAIVAALPEELRSLRAHVRELEPLELQADTLEHVWRGEFAGTPVVIAQLGDGANRAKTALLALLRRVPVSRIVVVGFAGALSPELRFGEVVRARRIGGLHKPWLTQPRRQEVTEGDRFPQASVYSAARLVPGRTQKARLFQDLLAEQGPAVVDLESYGLIEVAQEKKLPWEVLRVVSDTANEDLGEIVQKAARSDGSVARGRLLRAALGRPGQWRTLWTLKRKADTCATALFEACSGLFADEALFSP